MLRLVLLKKGMTENVLGGLFPGLVESIHIQLPNEAVDVPVPEVFRQDGFLELLNILDGELFPVGRPLDDLVVFSILSKKNRTLMISKAF